MGWVRQTQNTWVERTFGFLDDFIQRHGRTGDLPAHLATGLAGEDAAFFYLRREGYTVVARRWSSGEHPGDVDLIAWQGPVLCFIEVKARSSREVASAEAAVDREKRATLRRLASHYLRQLPGEVRPRVRFDVVSVYLERDFERRIEHFEGAFDWSERSPDLEGSPHSAAPPRGGPGRASRRWSR